GTFADGTHNIHELGGGLRQAGEIRDLMICTIECRPDEGVHTGRDPDVANLALALQLSDAGEQDAGGRREKATGLEPEFEAGVLGPHGGEQRIDLGQIQARLIAALRHAEATPDVEHPHPFEALREPRQLSGRALPGHFIEDAAPYVSLKTYDPRIHLARFPRYLLEIGDRHAKLGMRPGRPHVMVMPYAHSRIDTYEEIMVTEEASPLCQRVEVIDGDLHAALERPLVLIARCKVGRIEHTLRIEVREESENPLHLRTRHAFEFDSLLAHRPQQGGMRVGFHRIMHPRERGHGAQRSRCRSRGIEIVNVCRIALTEGRQEARAFLAPPWRRTRGTGLRLGEELLPGGPEYPIARHRPDEQLVELVDQPIALPLIDDEGEVEIVGRLADEVDLLLLEELERASQLVQDRADVAS